MNAKFAWLDYTNKVLILSRFKNADMFSIYNVSNLH